MGKSVFNRQKTKSVSYPISIRLGNCDKWYILQGSVLGPLLFIIFINDLPDCVKSAIKIFADDTKIYREIKDQNDIKQLQNDIDSLKKWSRDWQLLFSASKCKCRHQGKKTINIIT